MTNEATNKLTEAAITIAARAARQYLTAHNMHADSDALAACLKSWIKIQLPEALRDAKEAFACNMDKVAEMTFAASIARAGIEAAKEAGFPIRRQEFNEADCGGVFDGFTVTSDADPGM